MSHQPLHRTHADALARLCRFDAAGPSDQAIKRATELARLLPVPATSGPCAWFDRAVAAIAQLTFRESVLAVEGIRRLSGPEARGWSRGELSIEVELERVTAPDGSERIALRGQIEDASGAATEGWPVVALDMEGTPLGTAIVERGGYFVLDAPASVRSLAIAASSGAVILPGLLGAIGADGDLNSKSTPEG